MKVIKEVCVIFIVSTLPVIGAYIHGGNDFLLEIVKGMLAHKWVMYYTMIGALVFVVVAFLDWYFLFNSRKLERIHSQVTKVLLESATSFIGILRVSSGVLIAIPALWIAMEFNVDQIKQMSWLLLIGVVAAIECVVFSSWLAYIEKNWMRNGF